eukprot:TRINITY_DN59989_c0_g1_i1.p1 TRINITY_DN59989_c0_g1~~TRINITY_DN59989_c0_g1_i1.p1  ORF type:complete len:163 (-),score=16.08 TRINITY_DN59989_c0_g1_i1:230-718(-)
MASPPEVTEIPIPSFASQRAEVHGSCSPCSTKKGARRAAAAAKSLAVCCPSRLREVLEDVETLLLFAPGGSRTASLPYLGARVSQRSKEFLRSMDQRLFDVVTSYPSRFYIYEHDRTIYIALMHDACQAGLSGPSDLAASACQGTPQSISDHTCRLQAEFVA